MSESSTSKVSSWMLAVRYPLRSILTGIRFLTIIPVSWKSEEDGRFFRASVIWFPLIGLVIGSTVALLVYCVSPYFSNSMLAVLAVLLLSGFSGFLHLDGIADSGDGLLSSRPREQALTIMRDSRSGAMGVIVLVFLILAKYSSLSSLSIENLIPVLLLMPVAGRTAILVSMAILPYAREGEGLGQLFYGTEKYSIAGVALLFFILSCISITADSVLPILIAFLLTVVLFSRYCFTKLGGATGDTLGAVCELAELSVAVAVVYVQGVM